MRIGGELLKRNVELMTSETCVSNVEEQDLELMCALLKENVVPTTRLYFTRNWIEKRKKMLESITINTTLMKLYPDCDDNINIKKYT